jgi:UPF0755 protein
MKKRIVFIIFTLFICGILGVLVYAGTYVYTFLKVPPDHRAEEKIVLIKRGMALRSIAETLEQNSVVSDKDLFMILARYYRKGKSIKAGEYQFSTSMLPTDVLEMLQDGKIFFRTATIPEGYTMLQIAELLDELGYAPKEEFLALAFNDEFAAELNIDADNLEGYLFPNTYYIHRGMSTQEIIQKMVHEFWQVMTPDVQREIKQKDFTIHEVVTLASIIEKEVRVGEERELISAVYNNRLRIKMKLDSDPTVIYGLQDFDGNLTKADLQQDTPYNTYKRRGLPPGPIANPGEASILAAIRPAEVKYLYFVSRNDGTHEFSTNYNDHLRAVRKYQRNRKKSGS